MLNFIVKMLDKLATKIEGKPTPDTNYGSGKAKTQGKVNLPERYEDRY